MSENALVKLVVEAIDDLKGNDIVVLDVTGQTTVTDHLVIASGTSTRQLAALANHVVEEMKHHGHPPGHSEGSSDSGWLLVDGGDVVVHLMLPETRDFYNLEKLWQTQGLPGEPRQSQSP